jgi:hypothetical protein
MAGGLTRCHWPADPGSPGYCPIVVTFTPASYQGHIDGLGDQSDAVTIDFSGPVWGLTIEPSGALLCPPSGTLSPIQVYDSTGVLAASESFKLVDPINGWECGTDNVSNQVDTVAFKGAVKRVVITAPSPASWPFALDPTITAYMSQSYGASLNYYALDPTKLTLSASKNTGFVADTITFTASRPDGGAFTVSSWKWVADAGAVPPPGYTEKLAVSSCRTATSCRYTPGASGTMWVYATVNSRPDSASQHVMISPWSLSVGASPIAVHTGQSVAFKPTWSDGATVASASWSWRADAGTAKTKACNASPATCTVAVMESGTMTATSTRSGVTQTASFHVRTYTSLSLTVDRDSVNYGDIVTFTPKLDGTAAGAARWRWLAAAGSSDNVACSDGTAPCSKRMVGSGKMRVYLGSTAGTGDSALSPMITVGARRKLLLAPHDTIRVAAGWSVDFTASAEGGAALTNVHWSADDITLASKIRVKPDRAIRMSATGVSSTTCADGVISCTDQVAGSYTRTVTATVDDSVQTASVPVAVGIVTTVTAPDSTCYELGGSCWADSVAGGEVGPTYIAPPTVVWATFKLDFTDQNDNLHHFTLYNAKFILQRVIKTTSQYVDAIYAVDQTTVSNQESQPPGETLLWANVIPIRSTLFESVPGSGNYLGRFVQNGKALGRFWRPM